jgi:hypothetical protein
MAEEKSRLESADPALLARLELASKQFSKQLDERRSARAAEWLARAEANGQFQKSLLALAQKENPELRPALEAAQRLRAKRTEEEQRTARTRIDPSPARLLRSAKPHPHTLDFTVGAFGPQPTFPREVCLQLASGSMTSFDMSWTNGTLAPFGSFSPFVFVQENAFSDAISTESGTTMLGCLFWPTVSGILQFNGTGTFSANYMLDCLWVEAKVDIHIGTSFWDIGPNNLNAPVSVLPSGDQQVWGGQSPPLNFGTNENQNSPLTPFDVAGVGPVTGPPCAGFNVTANQFYILWIYFEVNAYQGAGANQANFLASFALSSGYISAVLNSINWTVSNPVSLYPGPGRHGG